MASGYGVTSYGKVWMKFARKQGVECGVVHEVEEVT